MIKKSTSDTTAKKENEALKKQISILKAKISQIESSSSKLASENRDLKYRLGTYQQRVTDYDSQLRQYSNYVKEIEDSTRNVESHYQNQMREIQDIVRKYEETQEIENSKPKSYVKDLKMHWEVSDSKGNRYYWQMPIESYESLVRYPDPQNIVTVRFEDGRTGEVQDHTKFVRQSFSKVIDEIYDSVGSEELFIYELWLVVSQLTIYSEDIGEDPRWALETLSRGGGDCEDTTILLADMIKSSKYTQNWKMQMIYFDSDNPDNPTKVNHVALVIDTGDNKMIIETTAKTFEGAMHWNGQGIIGWLLDV